MPLNTLCFATNMTSTEVAAWVQAIGSILAIGGALGAALWQAHVQHRNSLTLFATQQRHARTELAKSMSALATNCSRAITHMTHQFNTREAVHDVAEGRAHLDRGELERLDAAMAGIPLHNLPSALISPTMIVSAVIRQFREKVEVVIQGYHYMNSEQFADLFRVLHEMNESLRKTCDDILQTVEKIQSEEKNT